MAPERPSSAPLPDRPVDLVVEIGRGLSLQNPVIAAAGTFGFGVEHAALVDVNQLGAICTRGVTLQPRAGNRPPRTADSPAGLLNAVGLQNPGVDAVVERYAETWAAWRVPVIVNLAADSVAGFVELVQRLEGVAGVAGVELNLSCPNAATGVQFALDANAAGAVTAAVRRATDLPLLVKLSANAADIRPIARAIADGGADALSAVNTVAGVAVAPDRDRLLLDTVYGGLSGPAIKPIALRVVAEVAQVVDIPVIGMGGVAGFDDVLDFLAVGAVAVGVGTALFADPGLPIRLVDELTAECRRRELSSYGPLIGTALPKRKLAPSTRGVEYRP
ncbi:MAG TPA: dihydroorotate dehydrogenase [Candidatus Eisenbacteria bacterium]|nr:dihydroorotate dehydrogenase [Candidatus Eisenbacteria bacterium]